MNTTHINLNTPEGRTWALDLLHEKLDIIHVIVHECRLAVCTDDTSRIYAELCGLNALASECSALLNIIHD